MINPEDSSFADQAELAAQRFERQESDRWLRTHTFVFRYQNFFVFSSCMLMIAGMVGATIKTNSLALGHHYTWTDWLFLLIAMVGLQMMLYTQVRPGTRGWKGALVKNLGMFIGATILISIPGLILLLVLHVG